VFAEVEAEVVKPKKERSAPLLHRRYFWAAEEAHFRRFSTAISSTREAIDYSEDRYIDDSTMPTLFQLKRTNKQVPISGS